ncbi:porin [uncultured Caballeronia sp.]|uniref:porin n=1 Tax=uncultured Caballeronia sp. TaxID=1827198 RepID=UPI0035CA25A7
MFKSVVWSSALVISALASNAQAQSSVTLYGRLDVAISRDSFSNTGAVKGSTAISELSDISWFGLRGVEDLGGGYKAIFKLESWFNPSTGSLASPIAFFSRESYVGLSNADYGTVQLGSQFAPSVWVTIPTDPFGRTTNGSIISLMQQIPGISGNARGSLLPVNNAIQYITPRIGGFLGRLIYAPSGSAQAPTTLGDTTGAYLSYDGRNAYIGLSYENQRQAGTGLGLKDASVPSTTYSLGTTYDFRYVKVHGYLMRNSVPGLGNVDAWLLGLTVPVFTGAVRSSYATRWTQNSGGTRAALAAIGYIYPFSNRTSVYLNFAHLSNADSIAFGLLPGSTESYASQKLPGRGQNQNSVELGIRTDF